MYSVHDLHNFPIANYVQDHDHATIRYGFSQREKGGKTSASGEEGMEFKSRADQISNTLQTTRHSCNLDVWA